MRNRRKYRQQRVALRDRRRLAIRSRVKTVFARSLVAAIALGVGLGMVSQGDALAQRWMSDFAPQIEIQAPEAFPTLTLSPKFPKNTAWLWLPWVSRQVERRLLDDHEMLQNVVFEKNWTSRRVVLKPVLRKPLVRVGHGSVMDAEGVIFPWAVGSAAALPGLQLVGAASKTTLARWLQALSRQQVLWQKITMIKQDRKGHLLLELQSGTRLMWGPPDLQGVDAKTRATLSVLSDAQTNFRGAASADLRFFSEGRIMVTPKGK